MANTSDPVMAANLDEQLAALDDHLNALGDKAKARKDALEEAISQGDEFENDFDDFIKWLTKAERQIDELSPISADSDLVKQQRDIFKVITFSNVQILID